ncbi:MAG: EamA family transporter [Rhizobiales bacterium]|jgi:drug/metabolite transporter (DMT)-like permease|nr:EamA family transporter [Hyphomicrobiales bacterium]
MSAFVFFAVLAAAAMHAGWNAVIKIRLDRFASISLMTLATAVVSLPVLPFVAFPSAETWSWIGASLVFHTGYKYFLTRAYDSGDLAQAYPLARGSAPLLTTIGAIVLFREMPEAVAVGGIVLLSAGTFLMSLRGGSIDGLRSRAVFYALVTSLFITGYTLTDGMGARSADTALSYAAWLYIGDGIWSSIFCILLRGPGIVRVVLPEWKSALGAGFLSAAAYAIAMWAMTKAPIAVVAALRETSILFAMMLSVLMIGETLTRWRVAAALLIVGGVAALRLA